MEGNLILGHWFSIFGSFNHDLYEFEGVLMAAWLLSYCTCPDFQVPDN